MFRGRVCGTLSRRFAIDGAGRRHFEYYMFEKLGSHQGYHLATELEAATARMRDLLEFYDYMAW